jgi:hypothetical protein
MVHWNELSDFLKSNPFQTYNVRGLELLVPNRKDIDHFPILAAQVDVVESSAPITAPLTNIFTPTPVLPPIINTFIPTPVFQPKKVEKLNILKYTLDPIVFGIEMIDILYNDSPKASKRQMEIDEALRCEARIDELYKSQGGRSRGWTKTMLEAIIRPRCASGGDLHELKQAKSVFLWQVVKTDKSVSAFLDFLCVAKQIQVAIWDDDKKAITVYPAADYIGDGAFGVVKALYHVHHTGMMMRVGGVNTGKDLVDYATTHSWTLLPSTSVIHSLEKLTLADLESVGKKLGMVMVTGSKVERIAAIAGYKLKSRLLAGAAV